MKKLKKLKWIQYAILVILIIIGLIYLKTNSTEHIPNEDPLAQKQLNDVINLSKLNIDDGINALKKLTNLQDYTSYKRNYLLARLYQKKDDYDQAITIYENLLNKNYPLKERVMFHFAFLNTLKGNDLKALKYFHKLISKFPNSKSVPQAKYYLAQTELRLRLPKNKAIKTFLSLRAQYPKTQFGIATNYYLGENAYYKDNLKEALDFWREYLKLSPDGRFAQEISDLISLKKNIHLIPSDYSLLGDVFFHKKDYTNAAKYYSIENNPKKYYELGYSLYRIGKRKEAGNYLKEFAYRFPKSKNARLALLYASRCLPSYILKSFWQKVTKDIPSLAYYSTYKEALQESNKILREEILKRLIEHHPNSEFTLDAVWEIMWQKIKDKKYDEAQSIGSKYFESSKNSINSHSESRVKIGFFLGKIAEITNDLPQALEYYKLAGGIVFGNYYSFRAKNRLLALTGQSDPFWNLQNNANDFTYFHWDIPLILKPETIKNYFGATVSELISLQEYEEAMDLIGKSKSSSKKITAWLNALNEEYESSINTANLVLANFKHSLTSPIWKLAYPLYFWHFITSECKKYSSINPLLICSVIRQESRFDTNAVSISNAKGLMQIIPQTARTLSREVNLNLYSHNLLNDPKVNIHLGVHYLAGLINDFNNPLFAIASYNAGPQAVKNWIRNFKGKDLDFFIEEIPYEETRNYVRKVYSNYWTYLEIYKP